MTLCYYSVAGLPFLAGGAPARQSAATPQSDLPPLSIAVLPFENLSGDPEQAYLADGISEDLTTDLSHLDNAFVIARESAFSFRGKSIDVRDVGRQLGVRFVLEGSVRKIAASVRITAQLVATDTGAHLWAEHFDKAVKDLGDGQDDIVARIASALNVRMTNVESARRARSQSGSPAAFDLVLRARSILLEPRTQDRQFIAMGLFMQALRADPNSVPAMAGIAAIFASDANHFAGPGRLFVIKRATQLVEAAEQRAPDAPDVLVAKFLLLQTARRDAEALATYRHLLDVDTSATSAILQNGVDYWTDDPMAILLLRTTIQLNPLSSGARSVSVNLARALLLASRAAEARDLLLQTLALPPLPSPSPPLPGEEPMGELWRNFARLYLAIADVRTDRIEEAQQVIRQAMAAPSMREASINWFMRGLRRYDDDDKLARIRRFAADLRRAGMRGHLDEDADSGVASTGELQDLANLNEPTPMSIPGGRTVRTPDVVAMLASSKPLVLTTADVTPTIPGSIYINAPETGNLNDVWQANLGRLMRELTQADLHRPIIVYAFNINRWVGRNLALRIIALGYTDVFWYRGGFEAWEAGGSTRAPLADRRNL